MKDKEPEYFKFSLWEILLLLVTVVLACGGFAMLADQICLFPFCG